MQQFSNIGLLGLNVSATGNRIGQFISESGLSDKEISAKMGLSVQAINKWRHGRGLPDIENLYILGKILDKDVDDFLVPITSVYCFTNMARQDPAVTRLLEYYKRICECFKNRSAA